MTSQPHSGPSLSHLRAWPDVVLGVLGRCTFPAPGDRLDCAVSGGADSLALLVLAVAAGCSVTAVHVDHGLRPGSAAEADVVGAAAARFGAAFRSTTVAVGDGPNLEARARAARFAALPDPVATGHTMDDQAETVLINLLRGSGTDGVAGMRPGPAHPLLGVRRTETREVCEAVGLGWVEDPSNSDPRFLRNRVRHELLPLWAALSDRDPVPVLARQASVMGSEAALLDALSAEAVADPTDARALSSATTVLARRAVRRWLREQGDYPPSFAEVERVLSVAAGEAVATDIAGGIRIERSSGHLGIRRSGSPGRSGAGCSGDRSAGVR